MRTKSSSRHSTPLWREFEQLAVRIEQALVHEGATVKSPDRIRSLLTGRLREVDASIRMRVGTAEVVVTIECRRRNAKQDVTWLEQLGSKRQALGVAKTIAVSRSPFSADAVRAAAHYGVELRVVRDLTAEDFRSWVLPYQVVHLYKHCNLLGSPHVEYGPFAIAAENPEQARSEEEAIGHFGIDDPLFHNASVDRPLSFNDVWLRADQQLNLYEKVPIDGTAIRTRVTLDVNDNLEIETTRGLRPVKRITFDVALSWRREVLPLSGARTVSYDSVGNQAAPAIARAEFESKEASRNNLRLGVQTEIGSDQVRLSVEWLPGTKQ